jgi:hypothetical protein
MLDAADALTEIANIKTELAGLMYNAGAGGGHQVQLGANPVGEAMAAKSVGRYDGGDSFLAVVEKLLGETEKAERALKQCIDNYIGTDSGSAARYGGS